MSTTDASSWWKTAAMVAGLLVASAASAESGMITARMGYDTAAAIDSSGITGPPVASFQGVDGGTLTTDGKSTFELGHLTISPLPAGQSSTYGTHFTLSFTPRALDGVATPGLAPVVLQGVLFGTVTGGDTSGLKVAFASNPVQPGWDGGPQPDPPSVARFTLGGLANFLDLAPGGLGDPSPAGSGSQVTLRGTITSTEVVPEPTTLALFAAVGVAASIRRCRKSRPAG